MEKVLMWVVLIMMMGLSGCAQNVVPEKSLEIKNIHIIVPYDTKEYQDTFQQLIQQYNAQHQNVVVSVTFLPKYQYLKTLIVRYFPETKIDLVLIDNKYVPLLASEQYLTPVDEMISTWRERDTIFHSFLLNQGRVDGRYYGIPFTSDTYGIYINEDLFHTYGQIVPNSWVALTKATEKISSKGVIGFAVPAREDIEVANLFLGVLAKGGGNFYHVDDAAGNKVAEQLFQLFYRKESSLASLNLSQKDLTYEFCQGNVAVMLNSSAQIQGIKNKHPQFQWRALPLFPFGENESEKNYISGESFVVVNDANKEEINDFLAFLYEKEQQTTLVRGTGCLPVLEGGSEGTEKEAETAAFAQLVEHPYVVNNYYNWNYIIGLLQEGMYALVMGAEDPEELMARLQIDIREYRLKY